MRPLYQLPKNMVVEEFLETFDLKPEWQAWLAEYEATSRDNGSMSSFFNPDANPVLNPQGSSGSQSVQESEGGFIVEEPIFNELLMPLYNKWIVCDGKLEAPGSDSSVKAEQPLSINSDFCERYNGASWNWGWFLSSAQPKLD